MEFAFEFDVGQPEQVRASRVIYHRRRDTKLTYAFLVACLLLVFAFHFFLRAQGREGWWPGLIIVTVAVTVGMFAGYLSPYWMVRNIRKNNRAASGSHVLDETGLDVKALGTATSIEWANIAEAHETREFMFFYVSKGFAVLLPKRVVSAQDLTRLRGALAGWLGERAHTLEASGHSPQAAER